MESSSFIPLRYAGAAFAVLFLSLVLPAEQSRAELIGITWEGFIDNRKPGNVYRVPIDSFTPEAFVGTTTAGASFQDLDRAPDGSFIGITFDGLYEINPITAGAQLTYALPREVENPRAMAISSSGLTIISDQSDPAGDGIYALSLDGSLQYLYASDFNNIHGLAFAPDGLLYGFAFEREDYEGDGVFRNVGRLFTLDIDTGSHDVLRVYPTISSEEYLLGLAFDPLGNLYGINNGRLYTIDTATGDLSLVKFVPDDFRGIAWVPEPTTLALVGLGGMLMLGRRRKA